MVDRLAWSVFSLCILGLSLRVVGAQIPMGVTPGCDDGQVQHHKFFFSCTVIYYSSDSIKNHLTTDKLGRGLEWTVERLLVY